MRRGGERAGQQGMRASSSDLDLYTYGRGGGAGGRWQGGRSRGQHGRGKEGAAWRASMKV